MRTEMLAIFLACLLPGVLPAAEPAVAEEALRAAVTSAFGRLCARLKILDFKFHDLRHTAASWMRMGGADMHTVAELLGHKTLTMARRYQHLSPAFLAEAVGKLDGVFSEASAVIGGKNGEERDQDVTAQHDDLLQPQRFLQPPADQHVRDEGEEDGDEQRPGDHQADREHDQPGRLAAASVRGLLAAATRACAIPCARVTRFFRPRVKRL